MVRVTKRNEQQIEELRNQKRRTLEEIVNIVKNIYEDNSEIFQREPKGRLKTIESIKQKIENQSEKINHANDINEIVQDIAGVRIICCTKEEIKSAVDLIKNHPHVFNCETIREVDGEDEYGYHGHHLKVHVKTTYNNAPLEDFGEIQIRTLAQEAWAILSHRDFYKSGEECSKQLMTDMKTLSKLCGIIDDIAISIRQRRRDEVNEKIAKLKRGQKLTIDSLKELVKSKLNVELTEGQAYNLIEYLLRKQIDSITEYKKILEQGYIDSIKKIAEEMGVNPDWRSLTKGPVACYKEGNAIGLAIARNHFVNQAKVRIQDDSVN